MTNAWQSNKMAREISVTSWLIETSSHLLFCSLFFRLPTIFAGLNRKETDFVRRLFSARYIYLSSFRLRAL